MAFTKKSSKEEAAKREILKRAGRDDVHEQREQNQRGEGVVTTGSNRARRTRPRGDANARR
ncbi:MAG: hypothetical protein KF819_08815 [Labilithrix sp.]|nr:hypothetical protein [Labilithrix sp.]